MPKEKEHKPFLNPRNIGIGIAILLVLIFFVFLPIGMYNSFVAKDQDVQSKWSEVENQYQRQADLIPNLVSVVASYVGYESALIKNVTDLRTQWQNAIAVTNSQLLLDRAGIEMSSALSRLIAVAENYPELKANTVYIQLTDELSGTQNRIAVARGRYIESIQLYNTAVRTFPGNVYAGLFGFASKEYYQAAEGSLITPVLGNGTLP